MTHFAQRAPNIAQRIRTARHRSDTLSKLAVLSHYSYSDIRNFRTNGAKLSTLSKQSNRLKCLTALPLGKYSSKKLTLTLP